MSGKKDWKERCLRPHLEKNPERKEEFQTPSGRKVKLLYGPEELEGLDPESELGYPGEAPYLRGVQANQYRGRLWTMRQYAGFGSARETNERFRYLLEQGQTGLSTAFDLPTQMGYDSDHELADGEVGRVGVAVSTVENMESLFEGIDPSAVSTSMTINSPASALMLMYVLMAEGKGLASQNLRGTIQNDVLKEYIARGTYIFPPGPSLRLVTDTFAWCAEHTPRWNTISISGYHIREAGSTAPQELAFTFANAVEYVRAAKATGLGPEDFLPRLSFFFNVHNNLLEEVAKFRAARKLWVRILKEKFGVKDEKLMRLRFHCQTAGSTLTAQQPLNNAVRVTLQALAAVLGGTQSLHTNSYDEALALPTEESVRLALRTQQVIAEESGVADTVDPLGGSYLLESWTRDLEEEAWSLLEEIEDMGGAAEAIERGFQKRKIGEAAFRTQREIEEEKQTVVGVNRYQSEEEEEDRSLFQLSPGLEKEQREGLARFRENRDRDAVESSLDHLRETARGDKNLLPALKEALASGVTLGESFGALREIFGTYRGGGIL
ncbi:MAG: methylmalonyl-CoA mutase family protein [Candidatus Krumholzibacteria bacterium]|jgi:methylmalonyl-CoA mutase N-terminal domain/subunit|nr:methylmalonyl-CoA mutase family protein [Candidatus Krumholzibacteria bacterium]